ncbi:MAG: lysylphosphatidylglycerol synthase transmembrane domain-containing protein [Chloroflexota bacterium]
MVKRWRLWLGIAVSLAFLFLAVRQVTDFEEALTAAREANYWYLLPALAVYFIGVWVRSVRWHFLLGPIKSIPAGRLFPVVVIGYMANDILPARIGELVRAYVLGEKENVSKTATFATIIVERLFDGLTMLLFMGIVSLLVPFEEGLQQIVRLAGLVFVGGLLVVLIVASSRSLTLRMLSVALRFLPSGLRSRFSAKADAFLDGFAATQSLRAMLVIMGLSIVAWSFEAGMYYLLAIGFDLRLPFYVLALTTAVANLGTMVPSSPGYVGTFEALCVFTLGLFGADRNLAFSYTVVLHAALLVPITVWGLYYLWRYNLSLSQAQRIGATAPSEVSMGPSEGRTGGTLGSGAELADGVDVR